MSETQLNKCLDNAEALILKSFGQLNDSGHNQVAVASDSLVRANFSVKAYHESLLQIQSALQVINAMRRKPKASRRGNVSDLQ